MHKSRQEIEMKAVSLKLLLAAFCCLALQACATLNDVVKAKETGSEGTAQTYAVTADQAWDISKAVFRWEGADAIEEHRAEGYMLTSMGMNLISAGAVMGAWVEPVDKANTKVTVVTKRRLSMNAFTTLRESTFHKRFEQGVQIVKSGQKLPAVAPD
jgi:hypothetical protein